MLDFAYELKELAECIAEGQEQQLQEHQSEDGSEEEDPGKFSHTLLPAGVTPVGGVRSTDVRHVKGSGSVAAG